MAYSEAQKRATIKYQKGNMRQYAFMVNKTTEAPIAEWLDKQDNKQGYIKALILADMAKHQKEHQ